MSDKKINILSDTGAVHSEYLKRLGYLDESYQYISDPSYIKKKEIVFNMMDIMTHLNEFRDFWRDNPDLQISPTMEETGSFIESNFTLRFFYNQKAYELNQESIPYEKFDNYLLVNYTVKEIMDMFNSMEYITLDRFKNIFKKITIPESWIDNENLLDYNYSQLEQFISISQFNNPNDYFINSEVGGPPTEKYYTIYNLNDEYQSLLPLPINPELPPIELPEPDLNPDSGTDNGTEENPPTTTTKAITKTFKINVEVITDEGIKAVVNMNYNKPIVKILNNATITKVAYGKGKVLLSDFENFLNNNINPNNLIKLDDPADLSTLEFDNIGFYTIYLENDYDNSLLLNCVSTFPKPIFDIKEENRNIKINIETPLEITTIKIDYGHKKIEHFITGGTEIPITNSLQKDFSYTPTHQWYGKYTVYITLNTGESFIYQFLLGRDFLENNTVIEDSNSNYYAVMTNYSSNELTRFFDNLNIVYPICHDTLNHNQLTELLNNKDNVRSNLLNVYEDYLSLGYFDILEKYIDEANNLIIKFNIPVDLSNSAKDYFIYGFIVYSETDKKPVLVFRMEEPARKENTINTDFTLPLPIILQNPREDYPKRLFDDTNTLVTKAYLEKVMTNYDSSYAYASRLLVDDLKHRIDQKYTHLDPELVKIKQDLNLIEVTKDEINGYYVTANNLLNETINEAQEFKNQIKELHDQVTTNISTLLESALNEIKATKDKAIEDLKYLIDKAPKTNELNQKGLWKFLEIPNNDNHLHKFHFKVDFNNNRKVYFYLDLYTSTLDVKVDNEMDIPYPHIRFVSSNAEAFSQDAEAGDFGVSLVFAKEASKTIFYIYVYQPCSLTHSGNYYLIPNVQFISTDISLTDPTKYKLGEVRTYVTTKYKENEHNVLSSDSVIEARDRMVPIQEYLTNKDITDRKIGGMMYEFEDIKNNMHSAYAEQTHSLLATINQIQNRNVSMGNNFKHQSFTSNGTFNKPDNTAYIYVYIQGGTGASNSSSAGSPSSFGSYLSANGGSGSISGAGLKGETKSAMVDVKENSVPVIVGSGGIVIVSYSISTI